MIVGIIEDQHDVREVPTKIYAKHALTDNIATVTFQKIEDEEV